MAERKVVVITANLYHPVAHLHRLHGSFDREARHRSWQIELMRHRSLAAVVLVACSLAAVVAWGLR